MTGRRRDRRVMIGGLAATSMILFTEVLLMAEYARSHPRPGIFPVAVAAAGLLAMAGVIFAVVRVLRRSGPDEHRTSGPR